MALAALFDIDGTLLDSVDLHAECWREAFLEFGYDIPVAAIRSQIGKGGDQLMPVFLPKDALARIQKSLERRRQERWMQDFIQRVRPFPRVRALFLALRARGVALALASSAKEEELAFYKQRLGVEDLLDAETSADDAERSKPFPDIFAAALHRLHWGEREAWVVGDSPFDAQAAAKLGLPALGVRCGGFPEPELARLYRLLFDDPADLLAHLEASPFGRTAAPAAHPS